MSDPYRLVRLDDGDASTRPVYGSLVESMTFRAADDVRIGDRFMDTGGRSWIVESVRRRNGTGTATLRPYVPPSPERKPGSEGKPWSEPESDPLADILDAQRRMREDHRAWRPDTP